MSREQTSKSLVWRMTRLHHPCANDLRTTNRPDSRQRGYLKVGLQTGKPINRTSACSTEHPLRRSNEVSAACAVDRREKSNSLKLRGRSATVSSVRNR